MDIQKQWKEPEAWYRSFPFWAWNGRLEKEELIWQIRLMKEAGVGGFFIHSRDGLETEYMGPEWMDCVKAAVQEAKRLGMCAWLYDEDRFPSGTAGGSVTACGDAYRCKGLALEVLEAGAYERVWQEEIRERLRDEQGKCAGDEAGCGGRTVDCESGGGRFTDERTGFLAAYAACIEGEKLLSFRRLEMKETESFRDREVLLVVRLAVSAPSEWFNHQAPPDNLNPDCVKKFIALTHEKYRETVGEEFGAVIPGIFTDEPSLHDRHAYFGEKQAWIPWTFGLGAYFQERNGYDFLERLPWMYFSGEGAAQTRRDYWKTIAIRFGEAYFKTIGDWCEENHLRFTGHFLQEDKMGLAVRVNGAVMPNYQYQHVPGIDMLCEQTGEYLTVKQCTSAAAQLGKKQVLSETYGCTGWDFTFEGQKWMGDWQFVLGVNRRCQHLALYSLRGCRKRDYPPSFNYNTSWWRENKRTEDYFARLSLALEQGEVIREILLIHPLSTVWSRLGVSPWGNPVRRNERDVPELNQYGERFNRLIEELEREHLDLDLGDELLMEQYGSVRDGKLWVGQMGYSVVVIPPDMDTDAMLDSTKELLEAFLKQGGKVLTAENASELIRELSEYRTVSIQNGEGQECREVLYQLRRVPEGYLLFLVNNSRERSVDVQVIFPQAAVCEELDLLEGEAPRRPFFQNGTEGLRLPVHLGKSGSAMYMLKPCIVKKQIFAESLPYGLDHLNVLPLDMCRWRMDGGAWSETMEVWQAQKEIREKLGMGQIFCNGLEQRYRWIGQPHPQDGHRLELSFVFSSKEELSGVQAAAERLGEISLRINGMEIFRLENGCGISWKENGCQSFWQDGEEPQHKGRQSVWGDDPGWFLDKAFETTAGFSIRQGENELILACDYRNDMELENLYLLGHFSVSPDRRLGKLPRQLPLGDWTKSGLAHYCGSVSWILTYHWTGEREQVYLKLPHTEAVYVRIAVSVPAHGPAGGLAHDPASGAAADLVNGAVSCWETVLLTEFDRDILIGPHLRKGENHIRIEVMGSPRNMMGPFHLKEKPYNTHDASFCPAPEEYSAEYLLTPYGIMGEISITEVEGV